MLEHYDFFLEQEKLSQDFDIVINNAGFSHNQPNYSNGYDRREYYILHYIVDGQGSYTIHGETYHLGKDEGFVVLPDTTVIYRADNKHPWTVYWVGFHGRRAEYYLSQIHVKHAKPVFHFSDRGLLTNCMEQLYAEIQKPDFSYELILGYFYQTIGTIKKGVSKEAYGSQPVYYFRNAVHFIENNLRLPLKVQDLADALHLSPSHTYRIIKKECGLSPRALIEQLKMKKACKMLKETNISIQEISFLLGYEYVSHFSLVFKKTTHMTPGEYRSSSKTGDCELL